MSSSSDFFVVGGNLDAENKSYVSRPADEELYDQIVSRHFCYILTPRQMGKSSLMVRTAGRLEAAGYRTVQIDLTGIGTDIPADTWYQGLLYRLSVDLTLEVDFPVWWTEHSGKPMPRRFIEFLRTVVLVQINEPVTIFVDEIDSTLHLDFSDDFFAAIRFIYNERARDAVYNRLTFVLLGVATPNDLMKDTNRTPFNIGRRIELHEFSRDEAQVLADGLDNYWPGQGDTILNRVFYWTNGHPYLTQKLCEATTNAEVAQWTAVRVDELVKNNFLSDQNTDDSNLKSIEQNIKVKPIPEQRRLLSLYQKVYTGRTIRSNPRSSVQNYLILIGLVREENTCLRVRNEIYQQVFGPDWIKEYMPADVQRRVAILTSLLALFLVSLLVFFVWNRQDPPDIQAQVCRDSFSQAASPTVRMDALACLFDLGPGYDEEARRLFYSLSPTDQKYLFLLDNPQAVSSQLINVVKGIYVTLDQMEGHHDQAVLETMLKALEDSAQSEAGNLVEEIRYWKQGRDQADQQQYELAISSFTTAITLNSSDSHPVVHYDRAMAYLELRQYDLTLADLERTLEIAKTAPPTPTPTPTQPTPTSTYTSTPVPTNTSLPTSTPITTSAQTPGIEIATPAIDTEFSPSTPISASIGVTPTAAVTLTSETTLTTDIVLSLRFLNSDRIIQTVVDTIEQNENLQNFIGNNSEKFPLIVALVTPSLRSPRPTLSPTPTTTPTPSTLEEVALVTPSLANPRPTSSSTPTETPTPSTQEMTDLLIQVVDARTGKEAAQVTILLVAADDPWAKTTDSLGQAHFPGVLKDSKTTVHITISAKGYEEYDGVVVISGSNPFLEVRLTPKVTPTPRPAAASTLSVTAAPTSSPTITPIRTATLQRLTATPTATTVPTRTTTPTSRPAATSTPSITAAPTSSPTVTPIKTATLQRLTATPTATTTPTRTTTPTPRPPATSTPSVTATPTPSPTATAAPTPSPTVAATQPPIDVRIRGRLAIPLKYFEVFRVYVTGFDGQGLYGPNPISVENARQPMFRPGGGEIAVNGTQGAFIGIFKTDETGRNPTLINDRGEAYWPVWSPDGNEIIFSDTNLAYMLFRHSSVGPVSNSDFAQLDVNGIPLAGRNVLWTENNQLVFTGCAEWLRQPDECGIWVTDANQLNPERIITGLDYMPMDAKNGRLVLMSARDGDWDVYHIPLIGGDVTNLTNNQFIQDGLPALAPDGKSVAYISNASGQWGLWTITLATGETTNWFEIYPQRGTVDLSIWTEERMSWTR